VLFPVPTADERNGLVTVTPTSGAPYQLQVPVLPEVSTILNKYPQPNNPGGAYGPRTSSRLTARPSTATSGLAAWISASDKDSFFFRYSNATNVLPNQNATEPSSIPNSPMTNAAIGSIPVSVKRTFLEQSHQRGSHCGMQSKRAKVLTPRS
jgi:hypothetical protein